MRHVGRLGATHLAATRAMSRRRAPEQSALRVRLIWESSVSIQRYPGDLFNWDWSIAVIIAKYIVQRHLLQSMNAHEGLQWLLLYCRSAPTGRR